MHKQTKQFMIINLSLLFLIIFCGSYFIFKSDIFRESSSKSSPLPQQKILYWIDPMEPRIHYDHPGQSRMNMELVPVYAEAQENLQSSDTPSQQPTIRISPSVVNNLGIRTAIVEEGPLNLSIRAFGIVKPDEDNIIHIHSYAEGWIRKLHTKKTQEWVEKDQPLFEIFSPTLRVAQKEYLLSLKGSTNMGNEKADSEFLTGKLKSLGVSDKQIEELRKTRKDNPLVTIYAQKKGYVDALNIREGMWVKPEMTIMSLTDLSEIWIIAEVFPAQLPLISIGQEIAITQPQILNKSSKGTVDYIYPEVDPVSLVNKIRIRLPNPDLIFKPSMYVSVDIQSSPKNVLKVPKEAIIWERNEERVIVSLKDGKFQPRKVVTGIESSGEIEIISGLTAGEIVVTSAQFLLDSEINMKAALNRLDSTSTSSAPIDPQAHSTPSGNNP